MGSSGSGIGRAAKRSPEKFILSALVGGEMEKKKQKAEERAEATQTRLAEQAVSEQKLTEETAKKEVAEESVRKQKARARRRTIFAGAPLEQNLFRRTLGG